MANKKYAILLSVVVAGLLAFTFPVVGQEKKGTEQGTQSADEEKDRMSKEAQTAMVEAQRAFEKKDFATARKFLIDYLATKPLDVPAEVYLMLGYYWYNEDKFDEAIKVFKEGYEKFPNNLDLLSYYAATLYEGGKFAEAGPMMEKSYETSPKKPINLLEAAAGAYYQIEKYADAKRVIRKMMSTTKEPKETWFNMLLGICFEEEKYDEAEKTIFEALKLFPMNATYWQQLQMVRQVKEDWYGMAGAMEIRTNIKPPEKPQEFKDIYTIYSSLNLPLRVIKSIEISSKEKALEEKEHIQIAEAYARAAKINKAVSYLDTLIQKKPSSGLMLKKAEILLNARKNNEAIKACDDLIAFNPNEGGAYRIKGLALWDLEDWNGMRIAFTRAQAFKEHRREAEEGLDYIKSLDEAMKSSMQ
ncbi:MAG: tetratricopeptide repeat protein [Desulfatiglans sp.]|jgi:tetratricopeptide (TPR) repeat protein|nr:tetratricopeptide repeat protein [Desulfatiglans sp.]